MVLNIILAEGEHSQELPIDDPVGSAATREEFLAGARLENNVS